MASVECRPNRSREFDYCALVIFQHDCRRCRVLLLSFLHRSGSSSIRRSVKRERRRGRARAREEKCCVGSEQRHEERDRRTRKKDEWLYGGCVPFNELINNQSARCFMHHFDPLHFSTRVYVRREEEERSLDCNQRSIVIASNNDAHPEIKI